MTQDEFVERFIIRLIGICKPHTNKDYLELTYYGRQAGISYWEDLEQREEGPEVCAETDYSYWEE